MVVHMLQYYETGPSVQRWSVGLVLLCFFFLFCFSVSSFPVTFRLDLLLIESSQAFRWCQSSHSANFKDQMTSR